MNMYDMLMQNFKHLDRVIFWFLIHLKYNLKVNFYRDIYRAFCLVYKIFYQRFSLSRKIPIYSLKSDLLETNKQTE